MTCDLIDDMDWFFAEQWQRLADEIARESPQLENLRERAQLKADEHRERILNRQNISAGR